MLAVCIPLLHANKPKALLCVDGVALAPHRQVDVKDLDVDFYVSLLFRNLARC